MSLDNDPTATGANTLAHWEERCDLAAAFRWTARLDMHEGVANHFSLAVNDDGTKFLINPEHWHFTRMRASDLVEVDGNDDQGGGLPENVEATAWGLHGAVHRRCPHARCALHVHSVFATVLATMENPSLPPVDQNSAMFFGRVAVDLDYGGLALGDEAERACLPLKESSKAILLMGNHGVMAVGQTVAEAFTELYYFERAAANYVRALWTGKPLSYLSDEVAAKTARQTKNSNKYAFDHMRELRAVLDEEGSNYAT